MFENYPIFPSAQGDSMEIDFRDVFFWVKKPADFLNYLSDKPLLLELPPESFGGNLRNQIAEIYGLSEHNVLLFNGIQEALFHVTQLLRGATCKIKLPALPYFEETARYFKLKIDFGQSGSPQGNFRGYKAAFLSNPTLPFGQILYNDELEDLCREHPETFFVIEETFIDFCQNASSIAPLTKSLNNLIVLKSLSDRAAMPGINLSYVLAHPKIIETLSKGTPSRNISRLSVEAGVFLLKHILEAPIDKETLRKEKSEFVAELKKKDFLEVYRSDCHYFVVEIKDSKTAHLEKFLRLRHGILIDDLKGFKEIKDHQFRLCTLSQEKNQSLLEVFKAKDYLLKDA